VKKEKTTVKNSWFTAVKWGFIASWQSFTTHA